MLALYWNKFVAQIKSDRGAGMVEYALLVVLIALIAFIAIQFAGNQVSTVFSNVGESLGGTATGGT